MKKQTNLCRPHAGKLSLNKKTISNLNSSEMNFVIGATGWWCVVGKTRNGKTCPGHNTCQYTGCV